MPSQEGAVKTWGAFSAPWIENAPLSSPTTPRGRAVGREGGGSQGPRQLEWSNITGTEAGRQREEVLSGLTLRLTSGR